jgi:hypothetical protein
MDLNALLNPGTLAMLLPVLGLLGWIIVAIANHRERMAMIEKGMDPDAAKQLEKRRE